MDEKASAIACDRLPFATSKASLEVDLAVEGRPGASRELRGFLLRACSILLCAFLFVAACAPAAALADEVEDDLADDAEEKVLTPTVTIEVAEESDDGSLTRGDAADGQSGEWVSYLSIGTLPSNWDDFESYSYEFCLTPDSVLEIDASSVEVVLCDEDGNELADLSELGSISYEDGVLTVSFDDLKAVIEDLLGESDDGDDAADEDADGSDDLADDELATMTATYSAAYSFEESAVLAVAVVDDASTTNTAAVAAGSSLDVSSCTVVVSYDARLIAGLAQAGTDGAADTYVYIEYSAEPDSDATGRSVEDSAALYTWALSLTKVDADTGENLSGATFTIQDSAGHYIDLDGSLTGAAVEHETGEDGSFEVVGLDSGTYIITEVSAPDGYELSESFTLTISAELDGEVVLSASTEGDGASVVSVDADTGVVSVQVEDEQPEEETAGVSAFFAKTGDTLGPVILALAVVAAIAAAVLLVARRRRAAGEGAGGEGDE